MRTEHSKKTDFLTKTEQIRSLLSSRSTEGILLTKQCNISWLTHARSFVGMATESSCFQILITSKNVFLITNNIEEQRIVTEEMSELKDCFRLIDFLWYNENEKKELILAQAKISHYLTDCDCESDFMQFRTILTALDIELLRSFSLETAMIVENTCKKLYRGITEFEIAGIVSNALWEKGIEPVTVLIACDERIKKYRHPLPTSLALKKYAMVAVNARCHGLFTSVTRFACIGAPDDLLCKKFSALASIEATFIQNTQAGNTLGNIVSDAVQVYKNTGYEPEWALHHQGGPTGFLARECKPWINSKMPVHNNQVYAWNPSITGAKAEDTILVTEHGNEVLTYTGNFSYQTVFLNGTEYRIPDMFIIDEKN